MKLPEKITPAWLEKKKFRLIEIYRNGYRLAILRKTGTKWVHLTTLDGANMKMRKDVLKSAKPVIRLRGKWKVNRESTL
jgi:hypothetical protein